MKHTWVKRVLTLTLAGALAMGLTGCSGGEKEAPEKEESVQGEEKQGAAEQGEAEQKAEAPAGGSEQRHVVIGVDLSDSGTPAAEAARYNMDYLESICDLEVKNYSRTGGADDNVTFAEEAIAGGCDAIIVMPAADSVLPTICDMCEEAEVYWAIAARTIRDTEVREYCEASPYYVGACYQDNEAIGYHVGQEVAKSGVKKVAIISQNKGDSTCDSREEGIRQAFDEAGGIEIVAEARELKQASEITSTVESFLAAYGDLDMILCIGTTAQGADEAAIEAIQASGKDVKFASIGAVMLDLTACMESGVQLLANVPLCQWAPYVVEGINLINAVNGYQLSDEVTDILYENLMVLSVEDAQGRSTIAASSDVMYFPPETYADMLVWNNESFTIEDLQKAVEEMEPYVD